MIELKLPELGEDIETAEVSRLLVREGDVIKAEQNVMELDSDKASFPLPSPYAGKVAKVRVKEGDTVSVGQTVLVIEETDTARTPAADKPAGDGKAAKAPPPEKRPPEKAAAPKNARPPVPAGPATRKLARELGVNLAEVAGSESGGRITRDDVKDHVRRRLTAAPQRAELGTVEPALPDFSRWGPVKRQALNALARTSAQRLILAWRMVPHVTQHDLADITTLEEARKRFNETHEGVKPKLTVTALALRAAVVALKAYPHFNSSFDPATSEVILKAYYHLGVAVDTEHGLLVPVIRDVDRKTILALAQELAELAEKARKRSLTRNEMEGSTFTITNLGGIGGTAFTPIVNYPEVAILGMSRASWQTLPRAQQSQNRLLLPLSLSYDHRVINGADGARFLGKVAQLLSDPFTLFTV